MGKRVRSLAAPAGRTELAAMTGDRTRHLAAVMFTDMVGFTALMGRDEAAARQQVDRQRDVIERLVDEYRGRVLQFYGDGTLCVFGSAVEAVRCAVAIQAELTRPPQVSLRIGIHTGDIVEDGGGVYGDGVNVASRVEALAPPGGVLISDRVHEEIKNQRDLTAISLGTVRLKNVARLVEVFALTNHGLPVPARGTFNGVEDTRPGAGTRWPKLARRLTAVARVVGLGGDKPGRFEETEAVAGPSMAGQRRSVAVLPFANMSPDPENEYFCDGIAEEIINALTRIPELKVAGRTSAFSFKGRVLDVREIGTKLNVATVLQGSVRRLGDRIRITAQLVDVTNGFHLWSERFDRQLDDVFAIQDEIASNIAERLEVTIGGAVRRARPHTENVKAYELYLKGRSLLYQRGTAMFRAQECFEEALALDPQYALAQAGLADSYSILGYHGFIAPTEAWPPARRAAERAVALAPDLAEGHNALAIVAFARDWNWGTADREFRRSLQLNPSYVQARVWYAVACLQATRGDHEAAIAEAREAVAMDPLSAYTHTMLAYVLNLAGHAEEAIEEARKAVESDPDSYWGQFALATAYHGAARFSEAEIAYQRSLSASGRNPLALANLGRLYGEWDRPADASAVSAELTARSRQEYVQPSTLALAAASAGAQEEALGLLGKAYDERDPWLAWGALASPWFEPLRMLPGFDELLRRMQLPVVAGD
jgi:TolB-like protein/Flp pilus assembly protein TadD